MKQTKEELKKLSVLSLHAKDIMYTGGEKREKAQRLNTLLRANITEELNQKYSLTKKTLGHCLLILLGENQIEIKNGKLKGKK